MNRFDTISAREFLDSFVKASYEPADFDDEKQTFGIGELASELGVSHRTLRFYEGRGMVSPERVGSSRVYSIEDRERLQLIVLCKKLGFSLVQIGEILELYSSSDPCPRSDALLEKLRKQMKILKAQREDIDSAIKSLGRAIKSADDR